MTENSSIEKSENSAMSAEPASMADLIGAEIMPEVQESAIEAVQAQREEKTAEVAEAAEPVKRGRGRPKGTGTKAKIKSQLNTGEPAPAQQSAAPAGTVQVDSTVAAFTISSLLERTQIGVLGGDFEYSELERGQNREAWKNCLDYYGGLNLSPPLALVADHMAIIMARAAKPAVQTRFQAFKAIVAAKFASFRKKKNAQSDNRPDDVGKDDIRGKEGPRATK